MKILAKLTIIKLKKGINNVRVKALRNKNPERGLKSGRMTILQTLAKMNNIPRKIKRILFETREEISIRNLAFFWLFIFDLKLIFEINSCKAPTGHANPQKILPKSSDEYKSKPKIKLTNKRNVTSPLNPITMRMYCMGSTALGTPPNKIPPKIIEIR